VDNNFFVPSRVQNLLAAGMGLTNHWFPEDFSISSLAATLVGMANTNGGVVIFGVSSNTGELLGIHNAENVVDQIFQAALSSDPPLVLPIPNVEKIGTIRIVWVSVPQGLPYVFSLDGRYLRRIGSQTRPLTGIHLRQLLMERGIVQFETRIPPAAQMDDLDLDQVKAYMTALNRLDNEGYEDFLLQRSCLRVEDGKIRPTYAALLLFGKSPQRWLPNSIILAARFQGETYSDQFIKQEIRGTLPEQIRQAEAFVRDNLRSVARLVGLTRQETTEYPLEAIRELLVNAVAHRDYNLGGEGIQLHISSNRLEVHSPGMLPGPVNLENLLVSRFSRNAVIAQILSDLGFVERLGYGLNRVVSVMRKNGLPAPTFEEIGGTFRVSLQSATRRAYPEGYAGDLSRFAKYDLNKRQEQALNHLIVQGRVSNRAYRDLCPDVSPETLRRDLVDLVKKGILIKVGDKKATYYILKG
jgi:ATP-dependent DNA helicase RecG